MAKKDHSGDPDTQALQRATLAVLDYFLGDYNLKTISVGLFLGSYGVLQAVRNRVPANWQTPEGYALMAVWFFGPLSAWLLVVGGYRWCVRQNNQPTIKVEGHGSFTEAHVRVTLFGDTARVSLTSQLVETSGTYRLTTTPFAPDWFYEGDQTVLAIDQSKGRDANLEHGKGATVVLAMRDADSRSWYRQPGKLGEANGHPTAFAPLPVTGEAKETHASYRVTVIARPPLKQPCELVARIDYVPMTGFNVQVMPVTEFMDLYGPTN